MDKISVIIPVYRVEHYLARCVDSVLAQTYRNLEILLVDDGSPDGSGALCDAYAEQDSRVRVIHKENGGLSSARNAGIEAATGDYLAFVDSDDWIEPDTYEAMLQTMKEKNVMLVCAGRYDVDGETGERSLGLCPEKEEVISGDTLAGRIFTWDHCDTSACDKLFHRSLFREYRFPEGVVCEDLPVIYRVALEAGKAAILPKPVYNYYHRPDSISTAAVSEKTFHYSGHTAVIYPYIRDNYPGIEPQARFLRVRSLYHLVLTLEQSRPEVRRTYATRCKAARRELWSHLGYILREPRFGKQEKVTDVLLAIGLYRLLRPIFHRN